MALGAFFSAAEVIPLTFLTVEAWAFLQLGAAQQSRSATPFPHRWAVMFLVAVGFWNFLGAGHLRLPDQPADRLLLRDRHGADRQPRARRDDGRLRHARDRAGAVLPALPDPRRALAGAVGADLLLVDEHRPGLDVLRDAAAARDRCSSTSRSTTATSRRASSKFLTNDTNALLEWLRLPGDIVFIGGGALPVLYIAYLGIRHTVKRVTLEEPEDILFTEIARARGRRRDAGDEAAAARLDVSAEALLAAGYAVFLLVAAACSSGCRRTPTAARCATAPPASHYDAEHDHWRCPRGRVPVAARVRPRAAADALPGEGAHLQRLPASRTRARTPTTAARSSARSTRGRTPRPARFHRGLSLVLVGARGARARRRRRARNHDPAEARRAARLLAASPR